VFSLLCLFPSVPVGLQCLAFWISFWIFFANGGDDPAFAKVPSEAVRWTKSRLLGCCPLPSFAEGMALPAPLELDCITEIAANEAGTHGLAAQRAHPFGSDQQTERTA
jgi:hypothetical protein